MGFPGGAGGKELAYQCLTGDIRDLGLIPGWEHPLGKRTAPHSSILAWRIPMDRGAWWASVHGVTKSQTRLKQLSMQQTSGQEIWCI